MIRAQNLLDQLGIAQQDVLNLNPLSPAQQVLDQAAQDCVVILQALKTGVYQSPTYPLDTSDPMAQYGSSYFEQGALAIAMEAAAKAGNIALYHADLDKLNQAKARVGLPPIVFHRDIEVLLNAPGGIGSFTSFVVSQIEQGKTAFVDLEKADNIITAAQAGSVPSPAPPVTIQVGQPTDSLPVPVGTVIKDAAGNAWKFIACPFGLFWIRIMLVLCFVLGLHSAVAQVTVKFTPEPMAVPLSQLSNARDMGRWVIEGCNDGAAPVTLSQERISIAASALRFVDTDDAVLVLNSHVQHSTASTLVKVLTWAGKGAAIGLAIASRSNYAWAAGVGIGSSVLPDVVTIVQGEVPTATSLIHTLAWPITLPPGGCFTDHRFAGKMKSPQPSTVVIGAH